MLEHYRRRSESMSSEQRRYSDLISPREPQPSPRQALPTPGKDLGVMRNQLIFAFPDPVTSSGFNYAGRTPLTALNH